MNTVFRGSLGAVLEALGPVVVVASATIIDMPGPVEASKPEFVFRFSAPFIALAVELAIAGVVLLAGGWKRHR